MTVHSHYPSDVKAWARVHVEGFNAAHKELISRASLTQDAEDTGKIEGDRAAAALQFGQVYRVSFRFQHAYWAENDLPGRSNPSAGY